MWCFEVALFEARTFYVPSSNNMATVERWTFVNMFVAENFAVVLAVAKLPTMIVFWVLGWSSFTVAPASVSYWVAFVVSAASVSTSIVPIFWNATV